jgi:hypothetical protein
MGRVSQSSPRVGRAFAIFGATLLALVAGGAIGMRRVPALAFARRMTPVVAYPDPTWFLVLYAGGTQLDHTILWNGFGSSIAHARRADVLFLGNSRTQFALPDHELRAFEKRSGVSAFAMGLPFGERCGFPLRILERFDLRPRVVVANIDAFFGDVESGPATKVAAEGWWGGLRTIAEERLAEAVWPIASCVLPSFVTPRPAAFLLRSSTHGTWRPGAWPHLHYRAAYREAPSPGPEELRIARRVRDTLARRGARLVLTCVPGVFGVSCSPETTRALADELGVDAVVPRVDSLETADIGHLCPLSGKRFGRALLRDLGALPVIRAVRHRR